MSRELDLRVAKLLGYSEPAKIKNITWEKGDDNTYVGEEWVCDEEGNWLREWAYHSWPPYYSENITAAWEVFRQATEEGIYITIENEGDYGFSVWMGVQDCECGRTKQVAYTLAATIYKIPEALCLAYIEAKKNLAPTQDM